MSAEGDAYERLDRSDRAWQPNGKPAGSAHDDMLGRPVVSLEEEFHLPGGDGHWDNATVPETLEEAQALIRTLQSVLGFYSHASSYDEDSQGNEYPAFSELVDDKGLRARIARLSSSPEEYQRWLTWALQQNKRF